MDEFRRDGLQRAIREHLTEHGGRGWKLVRDRFSDVAHATFWRAVKDVRAQGLAPSGNKEHSSELTAPSKITLLFPAYCQPYQKLAEYEQLIGDAKELIEQAKGPGGKIKKWQMHAKEVSLRESLVRNQVQVMAELSDIVQNADFWQAFQEVVLEVSPEVQARLISRLQEFNDSRLDKMQGAAKAVPAPRNPTSVHGPAKAKEVRLKQGRPEKAAKNSRKPPTTPKQLRLV